MKLELRGGGNNYAKIALILLLSLMIMTPVMNVAIQKSTDFANHYRAAMALPFETSVVAIGHVLFHAITKIYQQLLPTATSEIVQYISIMTFMAPLPVIIFLLLKKTARGLLPDALTGALALGLTIASPLTIWIDNQYMIGYFNSIVYHNPTLIALRLFVIPLSIMSLWAVNGRGYRDFNHRFYLLLATACAVMLATLSKPSYTIVLLPSLVLFAIWRRWSGRAVDWVFLICGLCIPGGIILAVQYLYTFATGFTHGGSFMIEPLKFMKLWIPVWRMPIQLALSLVFPIGVYLLYFGAARKELYLNFSWMVFGVSAVYAYSFYQDGIGLESGNFLWSGYSAIFVLMFASLMFLVERCAQEQAGKSLNARRGGFRISARAGIAGFLFLAHILSGCAYIASYVKLPVH